MIAVLLFCLGAVSEIRMIETAKPLKRIINGSPTDIIKHPWQISLVVQLSGSEYHACGGSIVAKFWVLTAARCVDAIDDRSYQVRTNNGNLDNRSGNYNVVKIILHPEYNRGSGAYPNDVALLQVDGNLLDDGEHEIITIASGSSDFTGANCVISGWGRTATGGMPQQLQETNGTILSGPACRLAWGRNYNHEVHICIHNDFIGSCQIDKGGDNGGPMICNNVLAGVASWGEPWCITLHPRVYARVSRYNEWINTNIA